MGDRYWRSSAYSIKATMPILWQQRLDPGKEVGTREGARRWLAWSVGQIGGLRICECHRATPNLAGMTTILLGILQSGYWIKAMLLKILFLCEWSVNGS
jgi:hypothetical protein